MSKALILVHPIDLEVKWILEHHEGHTKEAKCHTEIAIVNAVRLAIDLLEHVLGLLELLVGRVDRGVVVVFRGGLGPENRDGIQLLEVSYQKWVRRIA